MGWLDQLFGRAAAPRAPEGAAEPASPAVQDLSIEVLVSESLRLGSEIDNLRQRRMVIKQLIDQKVAEREANAPRGQGGASIKAGG